MSALTCFQLVSDKLGYIKSVKTWLSHQMHMDLTLWHATTEPGEDEENLLLSMLSPFGVVHCIEEGESIKESL